VLFFRGLPVLIEVGLLVFCLIEAIQTPSDEIRNLPKGLWILLIVFVPLVGSIAWLVAGRPNLRRRTSWAMGGGFPEYERPGAGRPVAPDDDPAFLAGLGRVNREHSDTLRKWEDDLKRREEELRRREGGPGGVPDPS
jgi:hypothetical protein